MKKTSTLTVRANCPHTIAGTRTRALAHYAEHGVALWWRANGSATFFYRDPETGRRRQVSWKKTRPLWD